MTAAEGTGVREKTRVTSRERIFRTMKGQAVDRIPIHGLYVTARMINPLGTPLGTQVAQLLIDGVPAFDEWIVHDPNYLEIVREAEEKCERVWEYGFPELDRRFLLIP